MGRVLLWVVAAVLGGVAVLMTSFIGLASLLIGAALLLGRERWVAVSGFLTGFGALWTGLIIGQLNSGAERDGLVVFWMAVGVVPLAIGWVLAAVMVIHQTHTRDRPSRGPR